MCEYTRFKVTEKFLDMILTEQLIWDKGHNPDILELSFTSQLNYHLSTLAKYSNYYDFNVFMKSKVPHQAKTHIIISILSLLNLQGLVHNTEMASSLKFREILVKMFAHHELSLITCEYDEHLKQIFFYAELFLHKFINLWGLSLIHLMDEFYENNKRT